MPEDRSPPPDGSVESPESLRGGNLAAVGERRPPGCRGFRPPWRACGGVGRPRGGAEGRGQPGAAGGSAKGKGGGGPPPIPSAAKAQAAAELEAEEAAKKTPDDSLDLGDDLDLDDDDWDDEE